MKRNSRANFRLLFLSPILAASVLIAGCGGGGISSPSLPTVPTPFDGAYNATFTPSGKIPKDGTVPVGSLNVVNGRASLQTTFYLQPTVVNAVQKAINTGLTNAGYAGAISDNQVPSTIDFTGAALLDGSGKVVLRSQKKVDICGTATLTIDPTFAVSAGTYSGQGSYQITFPDELTLEVRGTKVKRSGTCNNLPLRTGTVSFTR